MTLDGSTLYGMTTQGGASAIEAHLAAVSPAVAVVNPAGNEET